MQGHAGHAGPCGGDGRGTRMRHPIPAGTHLDPPFPVLQTPPRPPSPAEDHSCYHSLTAVRPPTLPPGSTLRPNSCRQSKFPQLHVRDSFHRASWFSSTQEGESTSAHGQPAQRGLTQCPARQRCNPACRRARERSGHPSRTGQTPAHITASTWAHLHTHKAAGGLHSNLPASSETAGAAQNALPSTAAPALTLVVLTLPLLPTRTL